MSCRAGRCGPSVVIGKGGHGGHGHGGHGHHGGWGRRGGWGWGYNAPPGYAWSLPLDTSSDFLLRQAYLAWQTALQVGSSPDVVAILRSRFESLLSARTL